jgi:four helix bundle protein
VQNYHNLRVWHASNDLSVKVINALPPSLSRRIPGVRTQAIQAAMSIGANIAEGCGRTTRKEFLHFLDVAMGSATELENHLAVIHRVGAMRRPAYEDLVTLITAVVRMLSSLRRKVEQAIAIDEERSRMERTRSRVG